MLKILRALGRRSPHERKIMVESAAALLATRAGLRIAGFRRWQNLLARYTPALLPQSEAKDLAVGQSVLVTARAIAILGEAVGHHLPFQPTCLEKSLALWWLLRRHRIPANLRIGACKDGDVFEAHAWVESDGVILSESAADHNRFVPFESEIPSPGTHSH
jgi:hypothetical protein